MSMVVSSRYFSRNMVKAKKFVVKKSFNGLPKRDNFEVVEYELPPLKEGEILIKAEWLSLDTYLYFYQHCGLYSIPYDQFGPQVSTIMESKNVEYPVGSKVVSHAGWCDYSIINPNINYDVLLGKPYILPDLQNLPLSLAVGAAGMHGLTAYFGLLEVCKPKVHETIAVSGASGAVGSIVGQIAKLKGCKVIGFAGSEDKVQWLEEDLGFDKVINYKTPDISDALKNAALEGIDCYFDNVGGELSSQVMHQMNINGRICVCGVFMSPFEDYEKLPKATTLQPAILNKQLNVKGYYVTDYIDKYVEATNELVSWLKNGQIKFKEDNVEGFDNIFDNFIRLLHGKNFGRVAVKL